MESEKVKAVTIALCLFLLSALFFFFFFIVMIYLIFAAICFFYEVYDPFDAIWLAIFTAWLLHLAFISLVYKIRFALRGKNKIVEYWNASSQIAPITPPTFTTEADDDHPQEQEQEKPQNLRPRNKVNRVMVGATMLLCAVTSVYLGVWILVMVINEVVHEHEKARRVRVRGVLILIAALFIFLLFVLVIPVSCVYGRQDCCGGNKMSVSNSPKQHEIQLHEQRSDSDANP